MKPFTILDVFLDPFRMIGDISRELPLSINIWGPALNFPLIIGGAIFIAQPEGAMVLVSNLVALIIAGHIHRHRRFSKLIGLCHAAWLPVLPFLCLRLLAGDGATAFLVWLGYCVAVMTISLVLDIRDAYGVLTDKRASFAE